MTNVWREVFGDDAPVEVEIGPGRGDVLLAYAAGCPERRFFGIERAAPIADAIVARAVRLGIRNLRAVGGDARLVVRHCIPSGSVAAYHVNFPDPWPKTRHRARRLFHDPQFAADLRRTLVPGGRVHLATDVPGLLAEMNRACEAGGLVAVRDPPRARPRTRFERRYAGGGTFTACWARPDPETTP